MSEPRLRYLVVHLPAFRLERCGYLAEDLVGLIDEVKSAMRLVALTPACREAGLRLGMTAAEARSLVPDVELEPLDAAGEQADRAALVRTYGQLSDRVAFPWPDDLVLEVSCTAHLFGGEVGLVERAREIAASLGHRCRIVIADDPLGAAVLAAWGAFEGVGDGRAGDGGAGDPGAGAGGAGDAGAGAGGADDGGAGEVVSAGGLADRLGPLPVESLCAHDRSGGVLVGGLRALGVRRVDQLARLDAASVAGRFGEAGLRVHRLARGLPTTGTELGWGDIDGELPSVSARLAGATSTLQLHFTLPGLLAGLVDQLAARDLAVVRLKLVLRLERRDLPPATLGVGVGRPTRSPVTLERLIRTRLEGLRIDAPVDELVIEVVEAVPEQGWQPGLTDRTEATEPLPEVLARLRDHLGEDALITPRLADAWRPEAAWSPVPVTHALPREPELPLPAPDAPPAAAWSDDPVEVQQAWEQQLAPPRPTLLLPRPERITVELPAGGRGERAASEGRSAGEAPWAPHRLLGGRARLAAGAFCITRVEGPERLQGEWWSPTTRFDRTYYAVALGRSGARAAGGGEGSEGGVAWIFEEHGHWYLHGWFD